MTWYEEVWSLHSFDVSSLIVEDALDCYVMNSCAILPGIYCIWASFALSWWQVRNNPSYAQQANFLYTVHNIPQLDQ